MVFIQCEFSTPNWKCQRIWTGKLNQDSGIDFHSIELNDSKRDIDKLTYWNNLYNESLLAFTFT
jgi:hypothetical protein